MRLHISRTVVATIAVGGFVLGGPLLGSGVATADLLDDINPLLSSKCSFAQIDAAMHQVAPAAAARLDANPVQKTILKWAFSVGAEERVKLLGQLYSQRKTQDEQHGAGPATPGGAKAPTGSPAPEAANPQSGPDKGDLGEVMRRVAETCGKY
ncbi:hemophore-related protein [Nocardia sp. NPDC088792]|uniref:hemophore-related protein n=1 Tax=Nocardia sp. NPDC088792 TaxID=3364332 RepID=UPI00381B226D